MRLYLDTAPVIYTVENVPIYAQAVDNRLAIPGIVRVASDLTRMECRVSAPPAEREASGGPPEGGDEFGKAPLGLSTHRQIPTPIVPVHSFLAHGCICVWYLHPILPY
jgi:hypothetical protein